MFVQVGHGDDPHAARRVFLPERLDRVVEFRVWYCGQRFLQELERFLELRRQCFTADSLLFERRGGLVLLRDPGLGRRRRTQHRRDEVIVGGDVHQDFRRRSHALRRPPLVRRSGHRLGQIHHFLFHVGDVANEVADQSLARLRSGRNGETNQHRRNREQVAEVTHETSNEKFPDSR